MTTERITVRERIDPGITASLFSNYRSSADAVMELVDNALDSRLSGVPMRIDLAVHPSHLAISCVGGQGMGPRDLERNYLRWGKSPKRGRNLLGQYGQGGKAAIGHLGTQFSVEASRPDDAHAWRFEDPDYRDRSKLKTYALEEVRRREEAGLGYVRIRIGGVDRRVEPRRLGQRLADAYRPLLGAGLVAIHLNGTRLEPTELRTVEHHDFRVRAAGTTLTGWVGIADAESRQTDHAPGIRCYKLGRLIAQGETFGHPSVAQLAGIARLVGEVDLPPVPLTMNKSDFARDSAQWVAVEARMHRVLEPVVRRLAREVDVPPSLSALKSAEQARRLLAQALRALDHPELFAGIASGGSAKAGADAQTLPLPLEDREASAAAPESKRQRPPTSDRPQRRGFGALVIRPLDPAVRSQSVIEGDGMTIVINSRYPLFIERSGDTVYQLETAVREIIAHEDGLTVAEYERRVSEILVLAFTLRRRRRRQQRPTARQLALATGSAG